MLCLVKLEDQTLCFQVPRCRADLLLAENEGETRLFYPRVAAELFYKRRRSSQDSIRLSDTQRTDPRPPPP